MNARQTWVPATAVVLAALILGATLGPRTAAQKAEPAGGDAPKAEATAGRYQVTRLASARGVNGFQEADAVLVLDTATGRCWVRTTAEGDPWHDLGSPAKK
jgi:hypothetical protein